MKCNTNRKKDTYSRRVTARTFCSRACALLTAAVVLFGYLVRPQNVINVVAAETMDELRYYEWTAVDDLKAAYYDPAYETKVRTMLCWYCDRWNYISGDGKDGDGIRWTDGIAMSSDRQVDIYERQWITDNGRGAPYFLVPKQLDGDNGNNPKVTIYKGKTTPTEKTDNAGRKFTAYTESCTSIRVTTDYNDLDFKTESRPYCCGVQWTIEKRGTNAEGRTYINTFQNVSGWYDPVLKNYVTKLSCEFETDKDDRWKQVLYQGKEVKFSRYPAGVRCQTGQVTAIKANGVFPEETVSTIPKGSILSVNSTLFLNGKIVVDGGTLVIQEGGNLMSYSRLGAKQGTGCIEVKNGGAVVVMNNARLCLGRTDKNSAPSNEIGQLKLTDGGKLYNFGTTMVNRLILGQDAEIDNRTNSWLYAGYQFSDNGYMRFYFNKDWTANGYRFAVTGTGGSLISSAEDSVKSMEGKNIRITNKGTIFLSSAYKQEAGMEKCIVGSAPKYTKRNTSAISGGYETGF